MKKSILLSLLIVLSSLAYSQKYLEKITEESCSCLENIDDTLPSEELELQMGMCIIENSMPYSKQLKKDYGINMKDIDTFGEELGTLIGMKMATTCPKTLLRVSNLTNKDDEDEGEDIYDVQIVSGVITKVENEQFVVFSLKDETNKVTKYYWLTGVETDFELSSTYMNLVNSEVNISYETMELFDPKIEVYRQFKVITEITLP